MTALLPFRSRAISICLFRVFVAALGESLRVVWSQHLSPSTLPTAALTFRFSPQALLRRLPLDKVDAVPDHRYSRQACSGQPLILHLRFESDPTSPLDLCPILQVYRYSEPGFK